MVRPFKHSLRPRSGFGGAFGLFTIGYRADQRTVVAGRQVEPGARDVRTSGGISSSASWKVSLHSTRMRSFRNVLMISHLVAGRAGPLVPHGRC